MNKRIKTSLILLAALMLFVIRPVQQHIVSNPLFAGADKAAETHTGDALQRALIAYGSARVTNAFISLLQESEISVQPGGVGVTVAFFQLLDPLNDLIERFSGIMLLVIISLGVQSFLILLGPWLAAKLIVPGLIIWIAGIWLRDAARIDLVPLGKTVIMLALFLRFIMPFMTGVNDMVYNALLESRYENAISEIKSENREFAEHAGGSYEDVQELTAKMKELEEKSAHLAGMKKEEGLTGGMFNDRDDIDALEDEIGKLRDTINSLEGKDRDMSIPGVVKNVKEWINPAMIKKKVEKLIEKFLSLIMVFIINTIVFPLLFLWGSVKAVRTVSGGTFAIMFEHAFKRNIKEVFTGTRGKGTSKGDDMPDKSDER